MSDYFSGLFPYRLGFQVDFLVADQYIQQIWLVACRRAPSTVSCIWRTTTFMSISGQRPSIGRPLSRQSNRMFASSQLTVYARMGLVTSKAFVRLEKQCLAPICPRLQARYLVLRLTGPDHVVPLRIPGKRKAGLKLKALHLLQLPSGSYTFTYLPAFKLGQGHRLT